MKKILMTVLTAGTLCLSTISNAGTSYWFYEGRVDLTTSGARLVCDVYSISTYGLVTNDTVGHWCTIHDTSSDGHGVYMKYQLDGFREERVNFYGHENRSSVEFWRSLRGTDGAGRIKLSVCRDRGTFQSDNCSSNEFRIFPD